MYSVIPGQHRCPKCKKNVNGIVRVNKFTYGYPRVCANCAKGDNGSTKQTRPSHMPSV